MSIVLGIDPGLDAAIAELTKAGELVTVHDMPTLEDGAKGRRAIDRALLASIIHELQATLAYRELDGPRPTDSTTGSLGFGRSRGIIEGVLRRCRHAPRHDGAAGLEIASRSRGQQNKTARAAPQSRNGRCRPLSSPVSAIVTAPRRR